MNDIQFVCMWKIRLIGWLVLMVAGLLFAVFGMGMAASSTCLFLVVWGFMAGIAVLRAKA
jgi:hypothetical protein